jgi:hypothetical protein
MIDHVPHLVDLAALDQSPARKGLSDRGTHALAAVHDEKTHPLHRQATLDQVAQQSSACLLALKSQLIRGQSASEQISELLRDLARDNYPLC